MSQTEKVLDAIARGNKLFTLAQVGKMMKRAQIRWSASMVTDNYKAEIYLPMFLGDRSFRHTLYCTHSTGREKIKIERRLREQLRDTLMNL